MTLAATDATLEEFRVFSLVEHFLVVVAFVEGHVAKSEVLAELGAVGAYVGKHANVGSVALDAKTA